MIALAVSTVILAVWLLELQGEVDRLKWWERSTKRGRR